MKSRASGPDVPGQEFCVDLETFRLQIGYQNPLSNFRTALKQVTGTGAIPDYDVELVEGEAPAETTRGRGRKAAPVNVIITRRAAEPDEVQEQESDRPNQVKRGLARRLCARANSYSKARTSRDFLLESTN
ncbi:hypothetical protein ACFSHP_20220 [Novosphingobium panipatense]